MEDPACLSQYASRDTHWDHARHIQHAYGYHDFSDPREAFRLVRWLYSRAWLSAERPSVLFDLATARLVERKVLLPGVTTLERLVARVRDRAAAWLWQQLTQLTNTDQQANIDTLLQVHESEHTTLLDRLRRAPSRVSGPGLVAALYRKYFNADRGVTYYNFTSDQFIGFHAIVIPGTLRDSMYILDGLLEHQTQLRPVEVMADTAGVSDVVFGLFWLLGYQFSPRLADIGEARFWRLDPTADYGVLNTIARSQVNTKLIKRNWDDLLRVTGSLQQGRVSASELMRSILRSKRPSTLARAIGALGRIPRTLYI